MLTPGKLYKLKVNFVNSFSIVKKLAEYHVNDPDPNNCLIITKNDTLVYLGKEIVLYGGLPGQERLLFLTNNKLVSLSEIYNKNDLLDLLC